MPKTITFPKRAHTHEGSDSFSLHEVDRDVYETVDVLFITDTPEACTESIRTLRSIISAASDVLEVLEGKRTALLIAALSPNRDPLQVVAGMHGFDPDVQHKRLGGE